MLRKKTEGRRTVSQNDGEFESSQNISNTIFFAEGLDTMRRLVMCTSNKIFIEKIPGFAVGGVQSHLKFSEI